jgi:hypothetical protein
MSPRDLGKSDASVREIVGTIMDCARRLAENLDDLRAKEGDATAAAMRLAALDIIDQHSEQSPNEETATEEPTAGRSPLPDSTKPSPPLTPAKGIEKSRITIRDRTDSHSKSTLLDDAIFVFLGTNHPLDIEITLGDITRELIRLDIHINKNALTSRLSRMRTLGLLLPVARSESDRASGLASRAGRYRLSEAAIGDLQRAITRHGQSET